MPETVTCTACGAKLQVAAMPAPGKKLRCPKCKEVFTPTEPEEEEEEREEEEEQPAPKKSRRGSEDNDDDEDDRPRKKSYKKKSRFQFDGSAGDYFVVAILSWLLTTFTFGIGSPWALCMVARWQASHTLIEGRRLRFDGSGGGLFVQYLIIYFLCIITLGIYVFWGVPKIIRWFTENLEYEDAD